MTYHNYEFTAFTESDLTSGNIQCGVTFTMPGSASTCITVTDNDSYLSGDYHDQASDYYGQQAAIEGADGSELGNGCQIYAEKYHWVCDQHGNWYVMIEIEQEGSHADFFTFYTGQGYTAPPAGAELTVGNACNVSGNWIDFSCLDAGEKGPELGSISGRIFCDTDCDGLELGTTTVEGEDYTFEAEHLWEQGFHVACGENASGGRFLKLNCNGGNGDIATHFHGVDGCYNMKLHIQDENDGASVIMVKINGVVVDSVTLDRDSDGEGNDNGDFSVFEVNNIDINCGDTISFWVDGKDGEWVRFDKFELEGQDKEVEAIEPPKEGVEVQLLDDAGNVIATTHTDHNGEYSFGGLEVGDYKVNVVNPEGTGFTLQDVGSDDTIDSDVNSSGMSGVISIGEGQHVVDVDAGLKDVGSISGRIFCDTDCDGLETVAGTAPGQMYTIEAESMARWNYEVKHGENASDGCFVKLKCDWYGNIKDGDLSTTFNGDSNTYAMKLSVQDENDGQSTIMLKVNGVVVSTVVLDNDNNGEGNDNGDFSIVDFGDIELNHGDHINLWVDSDGGEFVRIDKLDLMGADIDTTVAEVGKADVTVKLVDDAGAVIATTVTDVAGNYSFGDLDAGDYKIMVVNPDGTEFTLQDVGSDDTIDSDVDAGGMSGVITVGMGENISNVDAGLKEVVDTNDAIIAGRVFCDSDDDNQDNGEEGVGGVTVTLLDENGDEVATAVTEADGSYEFIGLSAGTYTVEFPTEVDGKVLVDSNVGPDATDSDADQATGQTGLIAVGIGEVVDTISAGVEDPGTAALKGRVFEDTNNDNQDDGEPGVGGVTVTLLDENGDEVATAVTEDDGSYEFTGLDAGTYTVDFPTEVDGKVLVDSNVGDDATDSDADQGTGETGPITLGIGEVSENNDAGIEDPNGSSINGRVFMDSDDDNQDNGEMGVGGVTVTLLDENGDPVATDVTEADGSYSFGDLGAGTYTVEFPTTTADGKVLVDSNVGPDATDSDADQGTGQTGPITVGVNETVGDVDAGVEDPGTAALKGRVFEDTNNDNQDDGEPGVGGVTVTLLDENGDEVATAVTEDDGSYEFTGLDAGTYTVDFPTEVDGKVLVDSNVGDDATDSDADQGTGETGPITLGIGEVSENNDAGIEDPNGSSINGRVFMDSDDDNQDNGEMGVGGVTVTLLDENGDPVATDVTEADGSYSFGDLGAGTYTVEFPTTTADGKVLVDSNVGPDATDSDADQGTGQTGPITVGVNETVGDVDAGVEDPGTAALKGRVFEDTNNDNQDDGEPGVGGVTVTLLDENGDEVATAVTEDDGSYEFTGLDAGTYTVDFPTEVDGKVLVDSNVGDDATDSDADQGTGETGPITLGIGEVSENNDAGIEDPNGSSINGRVFMDSDDDNQDNGEMGVGGVTVTLLDENGDPVATDVTEADGSYSFGDLGAGTYTVEFPTTTADGKVLVDSNVGPDATDSDADQGTGQTGPITVGVNETVGDVDAGVEDPGTAALKGRVFEDTNNDNQDDGEPGVGGVTVTLLDENGDEVATAVTEDDGSYEFTGLDAGTYTVDFPTEVDGKVLVDSNVGDDATDSDADQGTGETGPITLGIGEVSENNDAGIEDPNGSSINGRVFMDSDDDNQDNGEMGVGGVTVTLLDENGDPVATDVTEADGSYSFGDLGAGTYTVEFPTTTADGKVLVDSNVGPDATDSDADQGTGQTGPITVGVNETVGDVDAGVEDPGTAALKGRVFEDTNNDNQDDGEPGVGGVTVTLLDENGDEVATAVTEDDGSYEFTGLDAGTYTVDFPTEVDGKVLVDSNVGDDATDSDADQGTGETGPITLGIGEVSENNDAGIEDPNGSSINGRVFMDSDDDNQDNGEMGVGGVTVTLLDENGDPVATDVTEADGSYSFGDLGAGTYTVEFPTTTADGKVLVDSNVGPDATDSDADQGTGQTGPITVGVNETVGDVDAGVEDPGTAALKGRVFEDTNNDNQDDGEPGVGGVTVTLLDENGDEVATAVTEDDGSYEFTGLDAGTYTVDFPTEVDGKVLVDSNVGDDATDSDADQGTGETGPITLGIGEVSENNDAGIEDPNGSSINGRVFMDSDDDNQDNGEMGVGGVTVTLLDENGDPVATDVTEADGSYSFGDLGAGTYTVEFPTTTADGKVLVDSNVGPDATDSDADQGTGQTGPITVGVNETVGDVDAGVEDPGTAALKGRVFEDTNNDNQDDGEPGVGGVTVTLLDENGDEVATAVTEDDGSYEFTGLDAGTYTVDFPTEVDGKVLVDSNVGDDATDSDADQGTGETGPITLGIGEVSENNDAGIEDPNGSSINGRVFMDSDDDNQDNGEMGVGGVTVTLLDENGDPVATDVTEADGSYSFGDLGAGTYTVEFPTTTADGKVLVDSNVGPDATDSDADQGTGQTGPITVGVNETVGDVDAGVEDPGTAALKGRVFEDTNNDNQDDGEPGVGGVTVTLLDENGDEVATAVTEDDGSYEFTGLDAGTYTVDFPTEVDGKVLVDSNVGDDATDSDADQGTGETGPITLGIGEVSENNDAGIEDPNGSSINGRVFMDSDDDNQDNGEMGVGGVTVTLLDENGDPVATDVTEADGSYSFGDLGAGTYTVEFPTTTADGKVLVDSNVGPDATDSDADQGTGQTGPITVGVNETVGDVDAGVEDPGTAALKGRVFEDTNNDNQDDGEPGVGGVTVTLLDENGDEVATAVTEDDGSYEFTGLDAGTYTVDFPTEVDGKVLVDSNVGDDATDSDADQGTGETGPITLGIGEVSENNDAGIEDPATASLSGRVFEDTNDNGIDDNNGDEPAVSGVTVELLDENGDVVATEVTDMDGNYTFANLKAGDYQVRFPSAVAGLVLIDPEAGFDEAVDSDAIDNNDGTATTGVISLAIGDVSTDNDAGLEDPNQDPVAVDDTAMTCADETATINLLEGDSDPDAGDTISVVSISDNDETAGVGESITLDSGAVVTLNADGTVEFDGIAAYADLTIGATAVDEFDYTIEDGNGGSDTGSVDVTVCGALNTKETISASLPQSGTVSIDFPAPASDQTYTVTITGSEQLDGVYDGWCIDFPGELAFRTELDGDWYSSTSEADLDELVASTAITVLAAGNMNEINWIINNADALYGADYDQNEIQAAIWQLTDGVISSNTDRAEAAQEIVDQADGDYMPQEGGLFGVIFAPTDASQTGGERGQTFIVAVPWEALEEDCIC